MIWKLKARAFNFERPLIMGILNLTPDSFSDGGKFIKPKVAVARALELEREGADIIDIGAESTRPNAPLVSFEEEKKRLFPILSEILDAVKVPISLDTTKSKIAALGLEKGVQIINDVSGLKADPDMAQVVKENEAAVVLMHRRGNQQTMQRLTQYQNLIPDLLNELSECVEIALKAGISKEQIAVDPGIGFSKTAEQNFEILRSLSEFKKFDCPILIGASKKSFLAEVAGKDPEERVQASAAAAAFAVYRGANILRVHDVRVTREAIELAKEIKQ